MSARATRGAAALLVIAAAGCAHRRAAAGAERGAFAGSGQAPREAEAGAPAAREVEHQSALWQPLVASSLPPPLTDVAALSRGRAIVLAANGLYRFEAGRVTPVCEGLAGERELRTLRAYGERVLALGGTPARPMIVGSDDAGEHCFRADLPNTGTPASGARFALSLDGAQVFVWTSSGAVLRSTDGGRSFARLPSLPGVAFVARSTAPDGPVFAAAQLQRHASDDALELFSLAARHSVWSPLAAPLRGRGGVELRSQRDGSVLVFDGAGALRLGPDGAARRVVTDAAARSSVDAPRVMVPAGEDRVLFSTSAGLLWRGGLDGLAPLTAVPPTTSYAIDADAEGSYWFASRARLYRGSLAGGPLEPQTSWPVEQGEALALSVRGAQLALVASDRSLARSVDGGQRWERVALPAELSEPLSLALGPRGETLALSASLLVVADAAGAVTLAPPGLTASGSSRRWNGAVAVTGDRWIVARDGLATSDDQGARWTLRLGPAALSGEAASDGASSGDGPADASRATRTAGALVATVFHGAEGFALDDTMTLYRTRDGASSFARVADATSLAVGPAELQAGTPRLLFDGARVVLALRTVLLRSTDGGASWARSTVRDLLNVRAATLLPDGRLLALVRSPRCRGYDNSAVALERRSVDESTLEVLPEPCAFAARAFAFDAGFVYASSASGQLRRAAQSALAAYGDAAALRAPRGEVDPFDEF